MRSFTEPETEFLLVTSDSPRSVDGYKLGEPTGEVMCLECFAVAENVDEIPHEQGCSQRFVHSEWYAEMLATDG
jgi:hypothetical protein